MIIHTDDYKKQYELEIYFQEVNSNKRTLKGFLWIFIALSLVWLLTIIRFFDVSIALVTLALLATIILLFPALCIWRKGDLSKPWVKYFFLALICIVSGVIISILSFHAVLLYVIPLLFAIQYRNKQTLWYAYVMNTATMLISSLISFYHGLCDLNLLFQAQHVRSYYLEVLGSGVWNVPLNANPSLVIIIFEVFPRSIILFVFTVMMQYTVISSGADALRIAQLTYLKETDIKTKVYNKTKYQEMIAEYYPQIEHVTVVFWDLNGLKQINDKYGHAMGDIAISKLSSALYPHTNDSCRVYRVGGDEFIMILDNPKSGDAERIIMAVTQELKASNTDSHIEISSAVGLAHGSGKNVLEIVKKADASMYENKRQYKEHRM